jgi:O-acetyl-ADP-ribose deacetylase (regulator of RNase III)
MNWGGADAREQAIHRAAGPDLLRECRTLDGCDTGSAKITSAYDLPCKKVIHAVGPVYYTTKRQGLHETLLRGCYRRSLELAEENEMSSIAFSALSTGVYGYPSMEAAEAAISEVRNFLDAGLATSLQKIVFCNFLAKDEHAYHDLLPEYFPAEQEEGGSEETATVELEEKLPDVPSEPVKKKAKIGKEVEDEDSDWEKVERGDVPQKVSVEEAVDEEAEGSKGKSRV